MRAVIVEGKHLAAIFAHSSIEAKVVANAKRIHQTVIGRWANDRIQTQFPAVFKLVNKTFSCKSKLVDKTQI